MVDVSDKPETKRTARATGRVRMAAATRRLVAERALPKGDVFTVARIAGVLAAKRTGELIPLCHPLPLSKAVVSIEEDRDLPGFRVHAEVKTTAPTGVEMEALTAVSVACLTLFDMLKAVDKTMRIEGVRVLTKTGGRSGDFKAEA